MCSQKGIHCPGLSKRKRTRPRSSSSEDEVMFDLADQIRLPLENTQQDAGLTMDEMDALDEIKQ